MSRDVFLGNSMVIPRGTPGHARITWRTGRGLYGKSAKMEFDLTDLVVAGSVVPLTGHYRLEGPRKYGGDDWGRHRRRSHRSGRCDRPQRRGTADDRMESLYQRSCRDGL